MQKQINIRKYIPLVRLMAMSVVWGLIPFSYIDESILQTRKESDSYEYLINVQVFAGNDTTICRNANLHIPDLNAYINGLVDDGYWFTAGDGYFLPDGTNNHRFSSAVTYIPGSADKASGSVRLYLVSDDPDGIGPMVQVTDEVIISLISAPGIACNNNLNIALGEDCTQLITPAMLVVNLQQPAELYTLVLRDAQGGIIPNNKVTGAHIYQEISYTVGHQCGPQVCMGTFHVGDYYIPTLACQDTSVFCGIDISPDSMGLPVSNQVFWEKLTPNSYRLENFDPCGPVILSFVDQVQQLNCAHNLNQRILRNWVATDESGNVTSCTQIISIRKRTVHDILPPPNYDNLDSMALECSGDWPRLPNGYPHPDFTGRPQPPGCSNIHMSYTDIEFESCGGSIHILRQWLILDHCTSQVRYINQTIKVMDRKPPVIECQESIILGTSAYYCHSGVQHIPLPQVTDSCSSFQLHVSATEFNTGNDASGFFSLTATQLRIENLPVGLYNVIYTAVDECQNVSTCEQIMEVRDNAIPFAICKSNVKVSLTVNGDGRLFAESMDNVSWDNCGIAAFEISKMTDTCGISGLDFGQYVDFCCLEANQNIMVSLKVTDFAGNTNICMAEVKVDDKIKPIITCPSNLTVSCDYDFDFEHLDVFGTVRTRQSDVQDIYIYDHYNNGYAGVDGYAIDNCFVDISSTYTDDLDCYVGTINRKFIAVDPQNNRDSCFQIISIANSNPFSESNIVWPQNYFANGCSLSDADTSLTGSPLFTGVLACANVAATYEDQVFNDSNGACIEILRKWTVVDWCQFDAASLKGLWTKVQVIKFNNTVKPTILSECRDTHFCIFDSDCELGRFYYKINAADDCTKSEDLKYKWKIDLNNNGSDDFSGNFDSIDLDLITGHHKVFIEVEDLCRNKTSCEFIIQSIDCKKPTPHCIGKITTVLMETGETHLIGAKDFDFGSYDNCTAGQDLFFGFNEELTEKTKVFNCSDLQNGVVAAIPLEIWVQDKAGNKDYCSVELIVQDNSDVCPDGNFEGVVIGDIQLETGRVIPRVRVRFFAGMAGYDKQVISGNDGTYWLEKVPEDIHGVLKASKQDDIKSGLTALDLVLTQRHILGSVKFESPYKVIAADVNRSNSVTVADLILIRKVILGEVSSFPNQVPNWRFIDKNHIFEDTLRPWNFEDSIMIEKVRAGGSFHDFIGVKMGDVNHSVELSFQDEDVESRESNFASMNYSFTDEHTIALSFDEDRVISGFQFSFREEHIAEILPSEKLAPYFHYRCEDGECRVLAYLPEDKLFYEGEPIFYITNSISRAEFQLTSSLRAEIYENLKIFPIRAVRMEKFDPIDKYATVLHHTSQGHLKIWVSPSIPHIIKHLSIFDVTGSTIFYQHQIDFSEINLDFSAWPSGIYFAKVELSDGSVKALKLLVH